MIVSAASARTEAGLLARGCRVHRGHREARVSAPHTSTSSRCCTQEDLITRQDAREGALLGGVRTTARAQAPGQASAAPNSVRAVFEPTLWVVHSAGGLVALEWCGRALRGITGLALLTSGGRLPRTAHVGRACANSVRRSRRQRREPRNAGPSRVLRSPARTSLLDQEP